MRKEAMLNSNPLQIKEGYALRPATMDDAPAVLEIMRACDMTVAGRVNETLDDILGEWQMPGLNLETDSRVVSAPDGRLIGYGIVVDMIRPITPIFDVYVHPDFWGDTFDAILMEWVEARARQSIAKAPADARVAMHGYVYSKDSYYKGVLERAGLQVIRHAFRMEITLENKTLPQPEWPEGITVRACRPDEDRRPVLAALRDSFQDHWGYVDSPFDEHYARWTHQWEDHYDPSLWFLAMDGEQIAGICLCRPQRGEDATQGWVGTLGVTRPYRRKGVGMALLLHAFHEFRARGKASVGLGVDASSLTGATRLYEKAGMVVAQRFDLYEKELRPGVEYGTQSVET